MLLSSLLKFRKRLANVVNSNWFEPSRNGEIFWMNNFVFHPHFCKSIRQSNTYLNIYLLLSYTKASAVEGLFLFDSIGSLLLAPANFRQMQLLNDIIGQRHYIASRVNHELYSSTTNILDIFFRVKNVSCETKKFTEPVREVEIPTRNPDGNRGDFSLHLLSRPLLF